MPLACTIVKDWQILGSIRREATLTGPPFWTNGLAFLPLNQTRNTMLTLVSELELVRYSGRQAR